MIVNGKERYKTMKNWKNCFIDRGATSFGSFLLFWITVRNSKDTTMTAFKKFVVHCMYQLENKRYKMTKSWQNVFRDNTTFHTRKQGTFQQKGCQIAFVFVQFSFLSFPSFLLFSNNFITLLSTNSLLTSIFVMKYLR